MKRHKQPALIPKVKPAEFGAEWLRWWKATQPVWRRDSLSQDVPSNEDWKTLKCGGSNGLVLVIMAISWWLSSFSSTSPTDAFWSSVTDVTWVLSQVIEMLSSAGQKRSGEQHVDEDQPKAKRFVSLYL